MWRHMTYQEFQTSFVACVYDANKYYATTSKPHTSTFKFAYKVLRFIRTSNGVPQCSFSVYYICYTREVGIAYAPF